MTANKKAAKRAAKRAAKKAKGGKRAHEKLCEAIYVQVAEAPEDPRAVVIGARARIMSKKPGAEMLLDLFGDPAGQAISIGARNEDEARKLWDVFKRYDQADDVYFRRIIGRSRFPNVAKLEMLPEPVETRDDDRPDDRTPDQRDRDASNGWMRWQGFLGHLAAHERAAITDASRRRGGDLQRSGVLTTAGAAFVAAMRTLKEIEGRG